MSPLMLDAAGHPDPSAAQGAGYSIIAQYLSLHGTTAPYLAGISAAGLGIVSIWEEAANAALNGMSEGAIDAALAVQAAEGFSQPAGTAIYVTVDFAPNAVEMAPVSAYVSAFAKFVHDHGYLAGCYGGTETLNTVRGVVDFTWQAAGWSNGVVLPWVNLRQELTQTTVAGVMCDVNEVLTLSVGAWNLAGPWPAPPTPSTGDDMAISNDWLIRNCYRMVLHREVDPGGYTTWMNFLTGGGDPGEMWARVQDSAEGVAVLAAERKSLGLG